jgi:uncharacterized protein
VAQFDGFEWDAGNRAKCQKHGLTLSDIESVFTQPVAVFPDATHSTLERRWRAIGTIAGNRRVFIVYTLRARGAQTLLRPISARPMHKKEIAWHEAQNPHLFR